MPTLNTCDLSICEIHEMRTRKSRTPNYGKNFVWVWRGGTPLFRGARSVVEQALGFFTMLNDPDSETLEEMNIRRQYFVDAHPILAGRPRPFVTGVGFQKFAFVCLHKCAMKGLLHSVQNVARRRATAIQTNGISTVHREAKDKPLA